MNWKSEGHFLLQKHLWLHSLPPSFLLARYSRFIAMKSWVPTGYQKLIFFWPASFCEHWTILLWEKVTTEWVSCVHQPGFTTTRLPAYVHFAPTLDSHESCVERMIYEVGPYDYKWPFTWVTAVITLVGGVRGPPCRGTKTESRRWNLDHFLEKKTL